MPEDKPKLETPCDGGQLLVRHAYSTCIDKTWHVVEDDYYLCPPGQNTTGFRVFDHDTKTPCTDSAPNPVGNVFKGFDGACQAPVKVGEIVISECVLGFWENATYDLYQCVDGSRRIAIPATHRLRTDVPCTEGPKRPEVGR
ncbi:MAG: hypothetical protein ABSF64_30145 [Bryobacteraceae bacterium]|jgi:hypothetical protein